jgi:hypothetical protein
VANSYKPIEKLRQCLALLSGTCPTAKEVKSEGEEGVSTLLLYENDKCRLNIYLSIRKR